MLRVSGSTSRLSRYALSRPADWQSSHSAPTTLHFFASRKGAASSNSLSAPHMSPCGKRPRRYWDSEYWEGQLVADSDPNGSCARFHGADWPEPWVNPPGLWNGGARRGPREDIIIE